MTGGSYSPSKLGGNVVVHASSNQPICPSCFNILTRKRQFTPSTSTTYAKSAPPSSSKIRRWRSERASAPKTHHLLVVDRRSVQRSQVAMHPHDRWISTFKCKSLASSFTEARKTLSISSSCRVFNSPLVNRSNTACSSAVVCTRPIPAPLISNELWNPYSIIRRERSSTKIGLHNSDRNPSIGQTFLGFLDGILTKMKNTGCQGRVGSPQRIASAKCSGFPAPPLATTGIDTASLTAAVISRSKPSRVPSRSMQVSTISPLPSLRPFLAQSTASSPVGTRPPLMKTSQTSRPSRTIRLGSILTTMHWLPNRSAACLTNSGFLQAAELIDTLSHPACNNSRIFLDRPDSPRPSMA